MKTPRLENWMVLNNHLVGDIYGDPRFVDGTPVMTSSIELLDFAKGECQTRNTLYQLGKQRHDDTTCMAKFEAE